MCSIFTHPRCFSYWLHRNYCSYLTGETKAKPQVEKVVSGKVTCSKSDGGIECACDDGLFWNGTHCNGKILFCS